MTNRLLALGVVLLALAVPSAFGAVFTLTGNPSGSNPSLAWGSGFSVNVANFTADSVYNVSSSFPNNLSAVTLTNSVGSEWTSAAIGRIESEETDVYNTANAFDETNNLSLTISMILAGQVYSFTPSISARGGSDDDIQFTTSSLFTDVQHVITDGVYNYTVGARVQWDQEGGSVVWSNVSGRLDDDEHADYRVQFQVLAWEPVPGPVGAVPEPATTALVGAGLALVGLVARRRMKK